MAVKLDKSKLVKNLAVKHKLVTHLDQVIGQGDFPWSFEYQPKEHDTAWHPSGDCTPSLHDLYLKATSDATENFSPALYKTFMTGHFWHQYLQHIVRHKLEFCRDEDVERRGAQKWGNIVVGVADPLCPWTMKSVAWGLWPVPGSMGHHYEVPKPFHWATGSADIAPCHLPGHGDWLIDFKTMNQNDFRRQGPPAWAVDKWECQANIYMDFFEMENALFVGICKDSPHDMREFEFRRNQPLIDAIYHKWKVVGLCLDENLEPPEDEEILLPLKGVIT